ncbi:hypothetical protein [Paenibacillus pini]|uniref:Uncharacterized protein n=1 Tax=Paenibacillus pini JCM 16418 TaxID=1236976 RepID=W7Y8S0_9BACL|nr:hypothetical protein [Paenibacillus pini]GAF07340.1 hypothetical protein JCM16418_1351 [Paenibacillus pini JCM 16418]
MKKIIRNLLACVLSLSILFGGSPNSAKANVEMAGTALDIGLTGLGLLANVLDTFFPLIKDAINELSINSGDYRENYSYVAPDFRLNYFYISAYDGISPKNSGLTWRIKTYAADNPSNPTETILKSGQQYSVRTDSPRTNMIFEFYNGNESSPFERFYLPYTKRNQSMELL